MIVYEKIINDIDIDISFIIYFFNVYFQLFFNSSTKYLLNDLSSSLLSKKEGEKVWCQ